MNNTSKKKKELNPRSVKVGQRIRIARLMKNITQQELASRIGVNVQSMYRYENGQISSIPVDILQNIAKELDLHFKDFIEDMRDFDSHPFFTHSSNDLVTDEDLSYLPEFISHVIKIKNPETRAHLLEIIKSLKKS